MVLKEGFDAYRKGVDIVENKIIHPILGVPFNIPAWGLQKMSDVTNWTRSGIEKLFGKVGAFPLTAGQFIIDETRNGFVGARHATQSVVHAGTGVLKVSLNQIGTSLSPSNIFGNVLSRTPIVGTTTKKVLSWLPKTQDFDPTNPSPA